MAGDQERPYEPPLGWRVGSAFVTGTTGFLSRTFLYLLTTTETHGLDRFLEILDSRKDIVNRKRGLITVSNHLSILDDPMIWGVLPLRYSFNPSNLRWALASYDICFQKGDRGFGAALFTYGNTLPTQRLAHSKYGGLFQPTITEVIRLLSDPHGPSAPQNTSPSPSGNSLLLASLPPSDPFSASELTYTTNGLDSFPAPSAYPSRRFSWVHIFPEGMIHQHPDTAMRYFKWGVARLILESEPCPDVMPMWLDGPQRVMPGDRGWPRPIPRPGKDVSVTFGELVDVEGVFGPFREKWRDMRERSRRKGLAMRRGEDDPAVPEERLGEVDDEELKFGSEAEQLRIDVTLAVRNEVLKVRRSRGFPDEDPKRSLAETWRREGRVNSREEGEMEDRSIVKDG